MKVSCFFHDSTDKMLKGGLLPMRTSDLTVRGVIKNVLGKKIFDVCDAYGKPVLTLNANSILGLSNMGLDNNDHVEITFRVTSRALPR